MLEVGSIDVNLKMTTWGPDSVDASKRFHNGQSSEGPARGRVSIKCRCLGAAIRKAALLKVYERPAKTSFSVRKHFFLHFGYLHLLHNNDL